MTDNDEEILAIPFRNKSEMFLNRDFAILYRTNAQSRSFELYEMGIATIMATTFIKKRIKDY